MGGNARAPVLDRLAPQFIVVGNLVPLAGVLWFGWRADVVLLLYWAENVVVGLFAIVRILAAGLLDGWVGAGQGVLIALFFTVHYGLFCAGHLFLLTYLFVARPDGGPPFPQAFAVLQSPGVGWSLLALALIQLLALLAWLARGEAVASDARAEMGKPYPRMLVLHVAIIAAGFLVIRLGQPLWAITALVGIKTLFDLATDWRARRRRSALTAAAA